MVIRCLTIVLLLAGALHGCGRQQTEVKHIVDAKNILLNLANMIAIAESCSAENPPNSLPQLVDWLALNASKDEYYIDYDNRSIKDPWGQEVTLMKQEGKVSGVGSAGPNGRWENGQGDDIVIKLEEVR